MGEELRSGFQGDGKIYSSAIMKNDAGAISFEVTIYSDTPDLKRADGKLTQGIDDRSITIYPDGEIKGSILKSQMDAIDGDNFQSVSIKNASLAEALRIRYMLLKLHSRAHVTEDAADGKHFIEELAISDAIKVNALVHGVLTVFFSEPLLQASSKSHVTQLLARVMESSDLPKDRTP
ncbi:MAG: hypothetical protein SFW64_02060 [Alphaproteobacteria bacterium]|nr:hypothetical protein [Alphaproteobacteria bacterium]